MSTFSSTPDGKICAKVHSYVGTLFAREEMEPLEETEREEALEILLGHRATLESSETPVRGQEDTDNLLETTLDEIDAALDDLDLLNLFECPEIDDAIISSEAGEASQPVAENVRSIVADELDTLVPPREAIRAIQTLLVESLEESALTKEEYWEARTLALDYLIHDWRWEEGQGVLDRVMDSEFFTTPEEKSAVQGMRDSWWDVYRVEDIDRERGSMHLERVCDGVSIDVETEELVEDEFGEGDAIIARIYNWSDGYEMGAWLPVDADALAILEEMLADIIESSDSPIIFENRCQKMKVHGVELVRELFFPDEDEEDDDDEEDALDDE